MPAAYLSHDGRLLTFVSRSRPTQQGLQLHLDIGHTRVGAQVYLKQARQTEFGDYICQGEVVQGLQEMQNPAVPEAVQVYARNFPRTVARLRALSPALPNFKALSVDLSMGGLKLETEDRLLPGSVIKMSLDLDLPDQEPVPLTCRVIWCQAQGKKFVVGLQFLELEPWIPPLLESFQSWLEGTGLKPKPFKPGQQLEFPEPETSDEEAPAPPAGSLSYVTFAQGQVELILAWTRGEIFKVTFSEVLVFRDDRGVEGAAFYDALDLEESTLMTSAMKVLPVSLETKREVYHYRFLNRREASILEVVCRRPAEYQLLSEGDG